MYTKKTIVDIDFSQNSMTEAQKYILKIKYKMLNCTFLNIYKVYQFMFPELSFRVETNFRKVLTRNVNLYKILILLEIV